MSHIPVLYEEVLSALALERGGVFVDGTLGGGGHSEGILKHNGTTLIGIDKDTDAIIRCEERFSPYQERFTLVHNDFKEITSVLKNLGIEKIDGALLDLGVSSFQIDQAERGFSYSIEAPLDMRMDNTAPLSAKEVVNEYSEEKLWRIISEYGEEKFAKRIAHAIVSERPVLTTTQLQEIIKNAIPAPARRTGGNPAKRTFQAIRIEVNDELKGLTDCILEFIDALNPGGRLAVISFHSLEDKCVKMAFKQAEHPCTCPPDFPVCVCGKRPKGKTLTRTPILPTEQEIADNPRAHSAKLRIFEKTEEC